MGRLLVQRPGYNFIDTGMMYRALTWLALELGLNTEDEATLSKFAAESWIDMFPSASKIINTESHSPQQTTARIFDIIKKQCS